jgi:peptidoglycan/xylan/chitin deacetylase (PgdA/CDA1 family)
VRIAYACYASAFVPDGVNKKIRAQLAWWRRAGHEAELFCLSPEPSAIEAEPVLAGHLFAFSGLRSRIGATVALARAVRRFAPDVVYLRQDIFVPPVWAGFGSVPLAVEINTDDRGEPLSGRILGRLYHELTRGLTLRAASGIVCVTHELARLPRLTRYGKPIIVIANGAESAEIEPLPPARSARPAAAMLIGYQGPWTGVDKAIALARALPELDLHLIGGDVSPGRQILPPNVLLHGSLSRGAYREVLAGADFGVGPLALHRIGMAEASPLKLREYLLHGLPVLTAHCDTDFLGENPWFLLRLSNTENNVEPNLPAIRAWIDSVRGRRVPRAAVIDRLAIEGKESARVDFLERLIDVPRGAMRRRGRRRPATVETPLLKPRAYYRAVEGYQRGRTHWSGRNQAAAPQQGVRILGYHRVSDDGDVLAVRRDDFRRQMEAVLACGARVVRLDAALELLKNPLDCLCVCVTFDDGYRDTLDHASPILSELGIPATVFLPTAIVDGRMTYYWYRGVAPPALDWDGVAKLVADGSIDVQSHSRTHPRLPALDESRAFDELAGSKEDIERLGKPVSVFCYPAGLYGTREARLVLKAGYRGAVTCRPGINQMGTDPTQLRRMLVAWSDDLRRFEAKLAGRLDRPSRLTEAMQRRRGAGG